jgi:signal transduction histidine kinase
MRLEEGMSAMTAASPPGKGRASRKILLVEDDDDLREVLTEALERRGHQVVAVSDGRLALEQMASVAPHVVVLDLMMPNMDGWQFRLEQRKDPRLADVPVVAISASNSAKAGAIDADLYLQKPLETETLLNAIDDVVQMRERKLEPVRTAQTERMASLGTLAAGVAHEVNNPLTYVLLHLANAARLVPTLATEQNRSKIEQVSRLLQGALEGIERIRGITTAIRSFSRSDSLRLEPVDVRTVVDAALRLVKNELKHRARLVESYGATPYVLVNEGRLGQVFLNLLTNAVQALPDGQAETNEVRVTTGVDGDMVFIEITDTGHGIPPHVMSRIFEPFFSTKPVGQGNGLGLSISHGIVTSFGGQIRVSSQVGKGTTFRVLLPPAPSSARDVHDANGPLESDATK